MDGHCRPAPMTPSAPAAATPLPPFRQIADVLREHAAARPSHTALVQGDRRLAWAEMDTLVDRIAAALQRDGVQPREAIAISGANSIDYALLFLGGLRAGVAVAPLPTGATTGQLAGMVRDSAARLLFADANVPALDVPVPRIALDDPQALERWMAPRGARPTPVDVQPDWPFNIIYSSGTTGTPKGIVQPHGMRWVHVARPQAYGYGPDRGTILATSLCSNTTLVCAFPTIAQGGCVVMGGPRFDARAYLLLAEEVRATHTMLVPVQYQRIMALPEFDSFDLSSFKAKFCTSAPFH